MSDQDVFVPDSLLLAWKRGPLPSQELENIAADLFALQFPRHFWAEQSFTVERNTYRRAAIALRLKVLQMDRWTLGNAVEKLTDESCQLVYGDRRLGSTIRNQVKDFAESYLEDLAKLFPGKLFYANQVDANNAEIAAEDANG